MEDTMTTAVELPLAELQQLEEAVRKSDGDGLHARWESGRLMLPFKKGKKQLPKGQRKALITKLGICGSEVNNRMAFATQFTEAQLYTAVERGTSWTEVRKSLPKTALGSKAPTPAAGDDVADRKRAQKILLRVVEAIESLDETLLKDDQELLAELATAVKNLMASVRTLTAEAA
jgi:hypothetical protein